MKAIEIKNNIYWVGAIDWNVRNFHGYQTQNGTTYNAYLIIDEKITLIDTVKREFAQEMLERIKDVISLDKIDIIISNHVEMDHSGSLPIIMEYCKQATIYTIGPAGVKGLTSHYGEYSYYPVKTGEILNLGKLTLQFVATPLLHWPDNMVTYCPEEKLLFSNDGFGQHLATSERFDYEVSKDKILDSAKGYYANILMCYGKQALNALSIVKSLDLDMIAPSHGLILTNSIQEMLTSYESWANNESSNSAVIVYDSMWHSTEIIAHTICEAFEMKQINYKLFDLKQTHISLIVPEILTCKYIVVGSPTLNNQMMPSVAGFLCYLKGLSPQHKKAFAFGSYGWGGQSISFIENELKACKFDIIMEGIKVNYIPTKTQLIEIKEMINSIV